MDKLYQTLDRLLLDRAFRAAFRSGDYSGIDPDVLRHLETIDTANLEKSAQKIILNALELLRSSFPGKVAEWIRAHPEDPNAFELAFQFVASSEYRNAANFAFCEKDYSLGQAALDFFAARPSCIFS